MSGALLALIARRLRHADMQRVSCERSAGLQTDHFDPMVEGVVAEAGVTGLLPEVNIAVAASLAQGTSSATSQQAPCFVQGNNSWPDTLYSVRRGGRTETTHTPSSCNYAYFFTGGG